MDFWEEFAQYDAACKRAYKNDDIVMGPVDATVGFLSFCLTKKIITGYNNWKNKKIKEGYEQGMRDGQRIAKEQLVQRLKADDNKRYGVLKLGVFVARYDKKISDEEKTEIISYVGEPTSFWQTPYYRKLSERCWEKIRNFDELQSKYLILYSNDELIELTRFIRDIICCDEGMPYKKIFFEKVWYPYLRMRKISFSQK